MTLEIKFSFFILCHFHFYLSIIFNDHVIKLLHMELILQLEIVLLFSLKEYRSIAKSRFFGFFLSVYYFISFQLFNYNFYCYSNNFNVFLQIDKFIFTKILMQPDKEITCQADVIKLTLNGYGKLNIIQNFYFLYVSFSWKLPKREFLGNLALKSKP